MRAPVRMSLVVLAALLLVPAAAAAKAGPAATVFTNGFVYTVDPGDHVAQAVAVRGDRIVYVGSDRGAHACIGPRTKVVDLRGKLLLPGFVDAHSHASEAVGSLFSVLLYDMTTMDEYLAAVADFAASHPKMQVIRGEGWSNAVAPGKGPLASSLDAVAGDRPVAIVSEDWHSCWVNSAALALAGITGATPDPEDGVIERIDGTETTDPPYGTPSGTLRETAADLVLGLLSDFTVQQYRDGIAYFQREVAAPLGITTVFDPLFEVGGNATLALEQMADARELTVVFRGALALSPDGDLAEWLPAAQAERAAHRHGMFRTPAVKIFADGVIEGHTAYLDEPYADALAYKGDPAYRGKPIWEPAAMEAAFAELDEAGFQIHVHSIGDAATTQVLDALAHVREVNGSRDRRPAITHLQVVDPADVARFERLGVLAVPQPYWAVKGDDYTFLQLPYLGEPRADEEYPLRSFFQAGVTVASGSDYPVTLPPDPLQGIAVGVNRWHPDWVWEHPGPPSLDGVLWPEERVSVEQMIRSFTIEGARANFLEKRTGSIEVGKRADLVVLDTNLLEAKDPTELFDAHVLLTMSGGKVLYDASRPEPLSGHVPGQ